MADFKNIEDNNEQNLEQYLIKYCIRLLRAKLAL